MIRGKTIYEEIAKKLFSFAPNTAKTAILKARGLTDTGEIKKRHGNHAPKRPQGHMAGTKFYRAQKRGIANGAEVRHRVR